MYRYLLTMLIALLLATSAMSQDSESEAEEPATASEEEGTEPDDAALDDENYLDAEEEDFVPSEDIPTDQAIPFPTDI